VVVAGSGPRDDLVLNLADGRVLQVRAAGGLLLLLLDASARPVGVMANTAAGRKVKPYGPPRMDALPLWARP
jgi:hypothetical protein